MVEGLCLSAMKKKCAKIHKVICNVCRMGMGMYREAYSVMLVDDEAYTRKLVGERISKIPGVTLAASLPNGFGAKRYLLEHVVDIVVTDIKMPLLDGLELAEFISEFVPSCPIIIISGYGEFEYARKAIQFGVKDYLLKPIQFKQIVEIIEKSCRTVQQRREQILALQYGGKDTQEQCAFEAFSEKNAKKAWELVSAMEGVKLPGTLLHLETEAREKDGFLIYKDILADALPGKKVIRVHETIGKYDYLILTTCEERHRSLNCLGEYFSRVLKEPVACTETASVRSSEELEAALESFYKENHNEAIDTAIRYMKKHLRDPLSRDSVAEQVFLSPNYFSTQFKQVTGVAYGEYLTKLRMEKACKLLEGNLPIREVAAAVGIHDAKYFSDLFCKNTGLLPSEYRRKLLQDKG